MSQSPNELPWYRGPAFWSFTDQTVIGHAAMVVIGIGVFSAVYALWIQLVAGDLTLLVSSHPGAAAARLTAFERRPSVAASGSVSRSCSGRADHSATTGFTRS